MRCVRFCEVTVAKFEAVGQGQALLEGDEGQQRIARQGQLECRFGSAMTMGVFLPGGNVAFVMVAVLDTPVLPDGLGGAGSFLLPQAEEENARMVLDRLGCFLFAPVALHNHRGAGPGQSGRDRREGGHGGFADVETPVFAFGAQDKKGSPPGR